MTKFDIDILSMFSFMYYEVVLYTSNGIFKNSMVSWFIDPGVHVHTSIFQIPKDLKQEIYKESHNPKVQIQYI